SQRKNFTDIRGIVRRGKGKIIINPPRKPIRNLDSLPFPTRQLLKNLHLYHHTPFRGRRFTTSMIASRGCPFNCSFCDQAVFGRNWRGHSANYVVEEIRHLKKNYGVDFISFEDDNFLISRQRAIQICQGIIDSGLKLEWGCSARVDNIDKELLLQMKKAGCVNIFIGIESGSPRVLKLLNKKTKLKEVVKAVGLIKKVGINVYGSVILAIPSETRKEMEKTISFIFSLPLDGVSLFLYTPYPNTKLAKLAPRYGRVSDDWQEYSAHPQSLPFVPHGFTQNELLNFQRRAYLSFYLRPSFLYKHPRLIFNPRILDSGFRVLKNLILGELSRGKR
ncbi:radical SAM protein, partial [Patescibacteria group bacterium]|nr:radical SAM protein [Patescibacteria group bacterium]